MFELPVNNCDRLAKGDCPLIPIVLQLQQMVEAQAIEIEALKTQVIEFLNLLKELRKSSTPESVPVPQFKSNRNKRKRRKKPGRKKGHSGSGRKRPDHIDETVEQRLSACPCCGEPLGDSDIQSTREHIQEDVVPARVRVTLYRHRRYRCPNCSTQNDTAATGDEIPKAKLGPRVLLVAALYKYEFGLPFRKIARMFSDACGLKVSHGALQQGVERLANWMQGEMDAIIKAIRDGPSVNVDETGWRVDGVNHWLWAFVNRQYTYYLVDRRRSSQVPKETLGMDYGGVIVSDFYSAYNPLPGEKQKCHVHLLRELHDVGEKNGSDEFHGFKKKLKRLLDDAVRLAEARDELSAEVFKHRLGRLYVRMRLLAVETHEDADTERLRKRLMKHGNDLLTFVDHPGVDKDNNRAERAIRPNVIVRKISGGNRSVGGANTHGVLMSVIATASQQGKDWLQEGKCVIQNYRDGSSQTVLA